MDSMDTGDFDLQGQDFAMATSSGGPDGGFLFEAFFDGRVAGCGLFQDRFGRVRSRFDIEMEGAWNEGVFVIDEVIRLDNGPGQNRRWRVRRLNSGAYEAQVDDVIGLARGTTIENGIQWRYRMGVPVNRRMLALDFDDRMFGHGADTVLNVSDARKWGLRVGRLVASYWRV